MKNLKKILLLLFICGAFSGDEGEMKSVSVMEGDSVTLNSDLTEIQKYWQILWRFGNDLIVQISEGNISYGDGLDGRFRDRLHLNNETASLTITNMRMNHSGLYELEAISTSATTYKKFSVSVYESPSAIPVEAEMKSVSVTAGKSLTLQTDVLQPRDELIVWRFGDEGKLIAKADLEANISLHEDIDERFRDRLKLDNQTGSLTITSFKYTDSGLYIVKISSSKQTLHKRFIVTVIGAVAGIVVALVVVLLVIFAAAAAGVVYQWFTNQKRHISEKSNQLSKISKQLWVIARQLSEDSKQMSCEENQSEISQQLEKLSEISEKLEKLCERSKRET